MFSQTIDNKETIVDANGNTIVDLDKSIFDDYATAINSYKSYRVNKEFEMRPDKVSFSAYNDDTLAEMILKYSGISNPFSLCEGDVVLIPDTNLIYSQLKQKEAENTTNVEQQVRNYYKFKNNYNSDSTSYDELEKLDIPSAIPEQDEGDYIVPYISEDGTAAITIRNGRMYFGEDNGNTASAALDNKIQTLIDSTATALSQQCAINGLSLADFVRASSKS